jgi:UDP-N-acetylmuramoyl-L-alanyl-D-glutamate--2,6-diaminopimelate ligase
MVSGKTDIKITGINIDSRLVQPGDLFVAIPGVVSDGHDFVKDAAEKGAVAVMVTEGRSVKFAGSVVSVADTRQVLSRLVNTFHGNPSETFNLIGVTGTNGKTSVATIIGHILKALGRKTGLISTIENYCGDEVIHIRRTTPTTPDSVELGQIMSLMAEKGVDDLIMEVSSMGLKMGRVSACAFDVGVFTNLSPEHLDDHGTMEDYAASKLMLFRMAPRAVVNLDDAFSAEILKACEGKDVIRYGIMDKEACDLYADRISFSDKEVFFDIVYRRREGEATETDIHDVHGYLPALSKISVSLNIPGQFAVYNLLAAVGTCLMLGFDLPAMEHALEEEIDISGRYEVIKSGGVSAIIDYAHTPKALENLLDTVRLNPSYTGIICVFGCGGDRDDGRRIPMGEIAGRLADVTIITSDNPRTEDPLRIIAQVEEGLKKVEGKYKIEPDRGKAIRLALMAAKPGMAVVIAGKGHENYQILGHDTIHFDDKEIVLSVFEGGNRHEKAESE